MKWTDGILIALVAFILGGCASSYPHPVFLAGDYYMLGGPDCELYEHSGDPSKVAECYTSDNEFTGKRHALSSEELQAYLQEQQEKIAVLEGIRSEVSLPNKPDPAQSHPCSRSSGC